MEVLTLQIIKYEDMVSQMQADQERIQEQLRKTQSDVGITKDVLVIITIFTIVVKVW